MITREQAAQYVVYNPDTGEFTHIKSAGTRVVKILTDWFRPHEHPVRDGVYIVRMADFGECWHACRWHGNTRGWYSAETTGAEEIDAIGGGLPNWPRYEWRGFSVPLA